jgi:hypothetical protein
LVIRKRQHAHNHPQKYSNRLFQKLQLTTGDPNPGIIYWKWPNWKIPGYTRDAPGPGKAGEYSAAVKNVYRAKSREFPGFAG